MFKGLIDHSCDTKMAEYNLSPGLLADCIDCAHSRESDPECSTADSAGSASEPELESPKNSIIGSPIEGAVIVFDWDDTLFPTSYVADPAYESYWSPDSPLKDHARLLVATLRAARAVARISIVTLSKRGWVYSSAKQHLPGLDFPALVAELGITIYYAFEHGTGDQAWAEDYVSIKRSAMSQCLKDWRKSDAALCAAERWNVLSVGDGAAEQWALKTLRRAWGKNRSRRTAVRPLFKTVKLMEWPTLQELSHELTVLHPALRCMMESSKCLDISASGPSKLSSRVRAITL